MHFIPTDGATKEALKGTLRTTRAIFYGLPTDWELHDISEDYGDRRRVYAPRTSEFMSELSAVYDAGALSDLTNIHDHAGDVDFYFSEFRDDQNRRVVGIRKATKLKGTLNARNRLMRLIDDTLVLIQEDVLHLDREFDVIVTDANVFILNPRQAEQVARMWSMLLRQPPFQFGDVTFKMVRPAFQGSGSSSFGAIGTCSRMKSAR
ncbi:hypothetical protein [Asticcacaulis tiandongensis]|uniref:hypothetical protein n=1 Tax=Asticcacaulis tiandongensis TaxID=2565365 RepID=UPI001126D376|nr:hypothetical protein [Asticcacaulis tiandongensis]